MSKYAPMKNVKTKMNYNDRKLEVIELNSNKRKVKEDRNVKRGLKRFELVDID